MPRIHYDTLGSHPAFSAPMPRVIKQDSGATSNAQISPLTRPTRTLRTLSADGHSTGPNGSPSTANTVPATDQGEDGALSARERSRRIRDLCVAAGYLALAGGAKISHLVSGVFAEGHLAAHRGILTPQYESAKERFDKYHHALLEAGKGRYLNLSDLVQYAGRAASMWALNASAAIGREGERFRADMAEGTGAMLKEAKSHAARAIGRSESGPTGANNTAGQHQA